MGKKKKFVLRHDDDDRLNVFGPKYCGWVDCPNVTEPGYGRCERHLKMEKLKDPTIKLFFGHTYPYILLEKNNG